MLSILRLVTAALMPFGIVSGLINPIIPGFNPDPSIVRVGEDYFLVTSTFEFFPGVPVYHSKDLVKWEQIGNVLTRASQLPMRGTAPSGGIFAPTLRYHKGRFYLITTFFDVIDPPDKAGKNSRSFYVSTDNIFDEKSWSDPTFVDQLGFDPDLFFDDDGKTYLTTTLRDSRTGHHGLFANWITEIDLATGDALTPIRLFHVTTVPEERAFALTEGSHLYKINGYYHMITADSGTEEAHSTNSYRAKNLTGPWEENPHNPLLWNGRDLNNAVLSTGHADIVEGTDGKWWGVFLATRPQRQTGSGPGKAQLGRETFLAPVTWDCKGWPVFNKNKTIVEHDPEVLYDLERPRVWRDDFNTGKLAPGYYTTRTPYKEFRDFTSAPGKLRLKPNPYTLSQRETPAAVFRKQVDINTTFSTELSDFSPATNRQEAGATVYLSIHYHSDIGVTKHNVTGKRVLFATTRTGPEATANTVYIEDPAVEAGKPVTLYIEARSQEYRLGFKSETSGEEIQWVASLGSQWLQAFIQGWQNFVGAHFGIYTSGDNFPSLNPADFEYIQTERA